MVSTWPYNHLTVSSCLSRWKMWSPRVMQLLESIDMGLNMPNDYKQLTWVCTSLQAFWLGRHIIMINMDFRLREIETQMYPWIWILTWGSTSYICTVRWILTSAEQANGPLQYFDQIVLWAVRPWEAVPSWAYRKFQRFKIGTYWTFS